MMLLVDTSVWSLALRHDVVVARPEVQYLKQALEDSQTVVTTGLVLQDLLRGFSGPRARSQIIDSFSARLARTRSGWSVPRIMTVSSDVSPTTRPRSPASPDARHPS